MSWPLWMLVGAAAALVVACAAAAVVDVDMQEALKRVLLAPALLLLAPLIWLATHLPGGGKFPIGLLRAELDHWEHRAWGVAWKSWAVVLVRRGAEKAPAPERVP